MFVLGTMPLGVPAVSAMNPITNATVIRRATINAMVFLVLMGFHEKVSTCMKMSIRIPFHLSRMYA